LQAQGAAHAQGTCWIGGEAEGAGHWNHPTALHSLKHKVKDGTKLICLTSVCSLVRKTEAEGQRSYLFSSFLLYYRRYNCWNNQMLEICCSPFGDWKKKKKKRTQRDGMKTVGAFIYSIEIWCQFLAWQNSFVFVPRKGFWFLFFDIIILRCSDDWKYKHYLLLLLFFFFFGGIAVPLMFDQSSLPPRFVGIL